MASIRMPCHAMLPWRRSVLSTHYSILGTAGKFRTCCDCEPGYRVLLPCIELSLDHRLDRATSIPVSLDSPEDPTA